MIRLHKNCTLEIYTTSSFSLFKEETTSFKGSTGKELLPSNYVHALNYPTPLLLIIK